VVLPLDASAEFVLLRALNGRIGCKLPTGTIAGVAKAAASADDANGVWEFWLPADDPELALALGANFVGPFELFVVTTDVFLETPPFDSRAVWVELAPRDAP
jgi:hypothetical protein